MNFAEFIKQRGSLDKNRIVDKRSEIPEQPRLKGIKCQSCERCEINLRGANIWHDKIIKERCLCCCLPTAKSNGTQQIWIVIY